MTGHTIYLIDQGLIHQTRMALSPVGTQADIDLLTSIYEEPWWLQVSVENGSSWGPWGQTCCYATSPAGVAHVFVYHAFLIFLRCSETATLRQSGTKSG
jgi:hypothetical protein